MLDNMSIRLPPETRLVFEVGQLQSATPALVARAGLLFVEDKDGHAWRCFMANWVKLRPEEDYSDACKEWVSALLEQYVPPCLRWLRRARATGTGRASGGPGAGGLVHPPDMALVATLLRWGGGCLPSNEMVVVGGASAC